MFRCVLLREAEKSDRCRFGNEDTHIFCRPDSFRERPFRHRHTVRVKNRAAAEERLRPNSPALRLISRRRGAKAPCTVSFRNQGQVRYHTSPENSPISALQPRYLPGRRERKHRLCSPTDNPPKDRIPAHRVSCQRRGRPEPGMAAQPPVASSNPVNRAFHIRDRGSSSPRICPMAVQRMMQPPAHIRLSTAPRILL